MADSRHLANRVEPEVVEALVGAVRAAYPRTAHRYYAMKARWLGKDKLAYWDRNAPLPEQAGARRAVGRRARRSCSTPTAASRPTWRPSPSGSSTARWIDAPVREGKSPGAFSHPTVPSAHPYILMNYQGKPRDVMTLAHELGHGVHQVLAAPQGPAAGADAADAGRDGLRVRRDADLPGAASTRPPTPRERKALLAQKVEDMINTVMRQIAFYCFERKVHEERRSGELTPGAARADLAARCRARAWARPSTSRRATRPTGPTSPTSSIRRSTSTPTPSATAW